MPLKSALKAPKSLLRNSGSNKSKSTDNDKSKSSKNSNKNNRSIRNLRMTLPSIDETSIRNLSTSLAVKSQLSRGGVRFSDDVNTKQISKLRMSIVDDLFYNSTDFSDFRHEAFMEECGLDPADFD